VIKARVELDAMQTKMEDNQENEAGGKNENQPSVSHVETVSMLREAEESFPEGKHLKSFYDGINRFFKLGIYPVKTWC